MPQLKFENCIAPSAQKHIIQKLENIQLEHDVRVLFAIESGSRAWGFPSPDSDYDVRFVYVRPVDWYLTINPGRDVIELPLEGDMDINGWDIKKALGLLLKPNPVLLEWLASPIRYIWDEEKCVRLQTFAEKIAHAKSCLHHYLNLGGRQWKVYIEGKIHVNLKKYLYAVRPAMAIRWIRHNPNVIPPMNFFELRDGIDLSERLVSKLDNIIRKKSQTKELGEGEAIPEINQFIIDEFAWAREAVEIINSEKSSLHEEADYLFRELVKSR